MIVIRLKNFIEKKQNLESVVKRTRNIDIFYAKFPFCIKNIQVNRLKTEVFKQKIMCDHPKHRTIELVDKVAIFVNRVFA